MAKSIFTSSSRVGDDRRTAIMKISNAIGEIKISYKSMLAPHGKVVSSYDVYDFLRKIWDQDLIEYQEQFCLICLSRGNYILGFEFIATGGTAGVSVDIKMLMQAALMTNASSIIVAHNHPSGSLLPSEQDKRLTQRLKEICRLMDIPLLDHVIMTKDSYTSFGDQGLL